MKTITLSDSHVVQLRAALVNWISELEQILVALTPDSPVRMRYQDELDVSRQALVLLDAAS